MKHFLFITFSFCLFLSSCSDNIEADLGNLQLGSVAITLTDLDDSQREGLDVQLRNTVTNTLTTVQTDAEGVASFSVTPGIYEALVSVKRSDNGKLYSFNGTSGQIVVRLNEEAATEIEMKKAMINQVVIKELYCGGCMRNNGVETFHFDKSFILYNNSSEPATLSNLCVGAAAPSNAHARNDNYTGGGKLNYDGKGFIPVWNGIWYFTDDLTIQPYSQVVVNVHGAIDNTLTVSQSVNYANPDYYCMYDPESGYTHSSYYPAPSELIPTSHYLKAIRVAQGNGWPLSVTSPALVVFQTHDVSPASYAQDNANWWYDGGGTNIIDRCVKVPNEWIVDAVEVFSTNYPTSNMKRLTADVDAGYVWLTRYQGHSLYRNVDKEATEALPENEGKLVYSYSLRADGTVNADEIDAEASIRQGAHIIYANTANSTNDFHERQQCSLKD